MAGPLSHTLRVTEDELNCQYQAAAVDLVKSETNVTNDGSQLTNWQLTVDQDILSKKYNSAS